MTNHPNRNPRKGTVTFIRHHSGFANVPNSFSVCAPGAEDDYDEYTESVVTYQLPDGYRISPNMLDEYMIYDDKGDHCDICQHSSGQPQLVSGGRGGADVRMPVLKKA